MKIKTLMLLLTLSAGACTVPPHSSSNQDTQQWQQTIQQLNTLLKERKHQAAIDEGKQKISELLAVAQTEFQIGQGFEVREESLFVHTPGCRN